MKLTGTIRSGMRGALSATLSAALLAVTAFALPGFAPPASAQSAASPRLSCGSLYLIAPGDNLSTIATRAYGEGDYATIFRANRDVLPDLSTLSVGVDLLIPCRDGSAPQTRAEALAMGLRPGQGSPAQASAAAVRPAEAGIGFLTGSDFAPFAHQALPEGGMITELVRLAVARAAPGREANITFVNDWSKHLELLEQGAYDLGFPWYRPDCARADRLSLSMRARCARLDFSEPLFEVPIGYYVRAGDPLSAAQDYAALFGRSICRPAGYFTFDLDQEDLRAPNVTRIIAPTADDCFAWLIQGKADVVTLNKWIAKSDIARLGLEGRAAEIPKLASGQTLHVVAKKGDKQGHAYLELVNKGLTDLQASGRWFEVVSRHLGAFGVSIR